MVVSFKGGEFGKRPALGVGIFFLLICLLSRCVDGTYVGFHLVMQWILL